MVDRALHATLNRLVANQGVGVASRLLIGAGQAGYPARDFSREPDRLYRLGH
jgi:hypothetical protein